MQRLITAIAAFGIWVIGPSSSQASTAGVTLTKVSIEAGQLVVEGTTNSPRTRVTIDRLHSQVSKPNKSFAFSLLYRPPDCIIELKTTVGTQEALVANCGPKGANFLGPWNRKVHYRTDDLVTLDGATWRARRDNFRVRPRPTANEDWRCLRRAVQRGQLVPKGREVPVASTAQQARPALKVPRATPVPRDRRAPKGTVGPWVPKAPRVIPALPVSPEASSQPSRG